MSVLGAQSIRNITDSHDFVFFSIAVSIVNGHFIAYIIIATVAQIGESCHNKIISGFKFFPIHLTVHNFHLVHDKIVNAVQMG